MTTSYSDHVNTLNPHIYWKFDEQDGDVINSTTAVGDNATEHNTILRNQPSLLPNGEGSCFAFGEAAGLGLESRLIRTNTSHALDQTVSCLFKMTELPSDSSGYTILDNSNSAIGISQNGELRRNDTIGTGEFLNVDQVYHLVYVFNESSTPHLGVYLDGVRVLNTAATSTRDLNSVGADYATTAGTLTRQFNGFIDEVFSVRDSLTESQISELYSVFKYSQLNVSVTGSIIESLIVTDFKVYLHGFSDGELLASTTTSNGLFSFTVPDIPYYCVVLPDYGSRWRQDMVVDLGKIVFPTNPSLTRFYFECTTAGLTGSSEPVWNTAIGLQTVDNTAEWTIKEGIVQPIAHAPVVGV
jgi:hypothetical protein